MSEFYEYSVIVEHDQARAIKKSNWVLENSSLCIYNSDIANKLPLVESSKNSKKISPIVVLRADAITKSLLARQESDIEVDVISHCLVDQKSGKLCQNEVAEIFNFEELFNNISNYGVDFDPREAQLRFKDSFEKTVTVTIYSKTAKSLFVSMLADPFDTETLPNTETDERFV